LTIAAVSGVIVVFFAAFAKNAGTRDEGVIIFVISLFFGVFAAFFWVITKVGNGVLRLITLFAGRKEEYEADKFAVKAGYGAGLVSFLDKIKNMEFGKATHILARLYATHPPIMLRIGELKRAMEV
jgi:heat shock protein HtpX